MAVRCSTEFRRRILGSSSFESIFNGGRIDLYSSAQPASADDAITGVLVASINPVGGVQFARSGVYAGNDSPWVLEGAAVGDAGWGRLVGPGTDAGGASLVLPRIDFAVGAEGDVGDFQMRLPSTSMTLATAIPIPTWWFDLFPST
jgi:hypothetical protein